MEKIDEKGKKTVSKYIVYNDTKSEALIAHEII
jgi:hypothetical protein